MSITDHLGKQALSMMNDETWTVYFDNFKTNSEIADILGCSSNWVSENRRRLSK